MTDEPQRSASWNASPAAMLAWPVPHAEPTAPSPAHSTTRRDRGALRPVPGAEASSACAEAAEPDQAEVGDAVARLAADLPEQLLPVVLALGCTIRSSNQAGEDLARLLNRVTEHLLGIGGPYRPAAVAEMSLAVARTHLGPDHPSVLDALANVAVSYQSAARGAEAMAVFDQILAARERLGGTGTRRVTRAVSFTARVPSPGAPRPGGDARHLLAQCLDEQARLDVPMAIGVLAAGRASLRPAVHALGDRLVSLTDGLEQLARLLNRATAHLLGVGGAYRPGAIATATFTAIEAHLGAEHPATLCARVNVAVSCRSAGRTDESLGLLESVLADHERLLGPEHPDTLAARSHLASSYQASGRLAEARLIFERVAVARDRLLGPEHPDTLTARTNLAACHHAAGRRATALGLFEGIAVDCERLLGPDDADTLIALSNVAVAYQSAGRLAESLRLFERVLVARVRLIGPDHPETLAARSELAISYQAAGRTARALASFGRVLADRHRLLGPGHPRTIEARVDLALALRAAGRMDEALVLFQRLAGECDRVLGADHATTLTVLTNLVACYRAAGRPAEALPVCERLAADHERLLGPEHPRTLTARRHLAIAYQAVGRTAKALALAKRVLADCDRVLGPEHPVTVAARAHLTAAAGKPAATPLVAP